MKKAVGHDLRKQESCVQALRHRSCTWIQVVVAVRNDGSGGEPAESVITS